MSATHLHIILIVGILVALGMELYFMVQAQNAKDGLVNGLTSTGTQLLTTVKSIF